MSSEKYLGVVERGLERIIGTCTPRAFVVRFRARPTSRSSPYEGRVEHLVSGQVGRFHPLEELLAFMIRVLTAVQEPSEPQ
jgi:hypothetical protein